MLSGIISFLKKIFQKQNVLLYRLEDDQQEDEKYQIFQLQFEQVMKKTHRSYEKSLLDYNRAKNLIDILSNSELKLDETPQLSTIFKGLLQNIQDLQSNSRKSLNSSQVLILIKEFIQIHQKMIVYLAKICNSSKPELNVEDFEKMIQELKSQNEKINLLITQLQLNQQQISLKDYHENFTQYIKSLSNFEDINVQQLKDIKKQKKSQKKEQIQLDLQDDQKMTNKLKKGYNIMNDDDDDNDNGDDDDKNNLQEKYQKEINFIKKNKQLKDKIELTEKNLNIIQQVLQSIKSFNFCRLDQENDQNKKISFIDDNLRNIIQNYSDVLLILFNLNNICILNIQEINRILSFQDINNELILVKLNQIILDSNQTNFTDKYELQQKIIQKSNKKLFFECNLNLGLFNKIIQKVSIQDILFLISLEKKQRKQYILEHVEDIIQKDYESEKLKQLLKLNQKEIQKAKIQKYEILDLKSLLQQEKQLKKQLIQSQKSFKKAHNKDIKLIEEVITTLVSEIVVAINKINVSYIQTNLRYYNNFVNKIADLLKEYYFVFQIFDQENEKSTKYFICNSLLKFLFK
ncbi:hypothetical protein TTHERM_00819450 (macronuclear) [Tetrahymena thermophila SB210]|uniref:Uncharacterized protein n=1 Tax=Tetrahymena thermophila (strain SB210) TaxID=312017 RepID=Q23HA0_TETTS|nr:hypothetical protein TTHERM_00819450 [Tetrahymena thermophila SB210]EAR95908.2 hypothetical protein TTHERM_00819450 [Tetrahymena thermophila SB210]|eukprot:XP_001016153.2 hypothetical protein TTHERM_00819450 [Tetrahymena thermophila SB210]